MPRGIYKKTEGNSRKFPVRYKICLYCKTQFAPKIKNFHRIKFCSKSCSSKSRPSGRLGKPCPEKVKEFLRNQRGEKHPNWKGGRSRGYKTGYYSTEYKNWRISVFERDNYKCQGCGVIGTYLTAHHIKSFAHYPELRFDINNGVTLCEPCHSLTDNYKGRNKGKGKLTKL